MQRRAFGCSCLAVILLFGMSQVRASQAAGLNQQSGLAPPLKTNGKNASPTAPPADEVPSEKDRDIIRVGQPWLRINSSGHSATVQALAFAPDSRRLFSAGLDKVVQVWDLAALPANARLRNLKRTFVRERTIRWQVSRGPRGSLFALACAPDDGLVAMGGYGAMGSTGEILLVNPADGTLVKVLEGHRQTICSLAFSATGAKLVSVDTDGECRLWQRGPWTSTVLFKTDADAYGRETAALIQRQPLVRPIALVGGTQLVIPVVSAARKDKLQWQLRQIALDNQLVVRTLGTPHQGIVTGLAATVDGSHLASADLAGHLYLWDTKALTQPVRLASDRVVRSLAFSPDGKSLAVGTGVSSVTLTSQLQFWDVATRKQTSSRTLADHVQACGYSPDGKIFAYVGGSKNEVFVDRLSGAASPPAVLAGTSRKVLKVAFAAEKPFYRVAFGTKPRKGSFNDYADLEESFDPQRGQLDVHGQVRPADWLPLNWLAGNWRLQPSADRASLQLYEGNAPRGVIQLDPQSQGQPRCICWIPGADGKPFAVAVGTDKQNMICVFRISPRGPCPLLRQFRGHQDLVTSVAVSRDLRVLVSGSADGTLAFWSLSDYREGPATSGRWGSGFHVADGKLIVQATNEAGPLFQKGVRRGDSLTQIRWSEGRQIRGETAPQAMLDRLRDLPWFAQVEFDFSRAGKAPLSFQLVPAWQALASLLVNEDREWAFWTPDGYYNASVNGHTLFGWQVNRGLNALPNFYRADQFRRNLERPDVLERLLPSGSLEAALRNAKEAAVVEPERMLTSQIEATPTVTILSPRPGDMVRDRKVTVRAQITLPAAGKVAETRVFANGVVARQRQLISQRVDAASGGHELVYEWEALLPKEAKNLIQVFVLTEAKTTAFERVLVEQPELPPAVSPRLYVLAVGVNNYRDPGIEDLDYSVADAQAVVAELQKASQGLYEVVPPILLANESVTRAQWKNTFVELSARLKDVARPDDLLVVFMAGHGEVDPRDQSYHFICNDARLDTLLDGNGTISWDDFRLFADIPCRKLALLDTCHSGAIQGVREQSKSATREFQENLVFTMAAAADDESSQESSEWKHGAFTKSLLDGLAGAADDSHDGVVTLDELVDYAHRMVPKLTGDYQHPTAAPEELLQYISLPLSLGPASVAPRVQDASTRSQSRK